MWGRSEVLTEWKTEPLPCVVFLLALVTGAAARRDLPVQLSYPDSQVTKMKQVKRTQHETATFTRN